MLYVYSQHLELLATEEEEEEKKIGREVGAALI